MYPARTTLQKGWTLYGREMIGGSHAVVRPGILESIQDTAARLFDKEANHLLTVSQNDRSQTQKKRDTRFHAPSARHLRHWLFTDSFTVNLGTPYTLGTTSDGFACVLQNCIVDWT
jgi:hypothetical protein